MPPNTEGPTRDRAPFKELHENVLQVRVIAPPDFHLRGEGMEKFLYNMTEAAGMEDFTVPVVLDPDNSETNPLSAEHPLGGRKQARDENGSLGWRDSWINACVYNSTRDDRGVQVTVVAHSCGEIPTQKLLRAIYSLLHPAQMRWSMISSANGVSDFKDYELEGDEHFKAIVDLLWENPQTRDEKVVVGQLLEKEVLARKKLKNKQRRLAQLPDLLLKDEMRKLQELFGDYEGILEQEAAQKIIAGETGLEAFPYLKRYNQLTDSEILNTAMNDGNVKTVCMIGGGWLPISAILYAQKTKAHIFAVEKDPSRAQIAVQVVESLDLQDRITIINQEAEEVDYTTIDVVVFAAMAEPKYKIFQKVTSTDFPRNVALRGPLGDSQAFYPTFTNELPYLIPFEEPINHVPMREDFKADKDGVFSVVYFDSMRVAHLT